MVHQYKRLKIKAVRVLSLVLLAGICNSVSGKTIVTLAPHLTEWIYSLEAQSNLLAVSAYSDFPVEAQQLPVVADYHGVDFKKIMELNPDLVLAWQGGNKPQDIARLKSLGFNVFLSSPHQVSDIAREINQLGKLLGREVLAATLTTSFSQELEALHHQYDGQPPIRAFYYVWSQPLMSIGPDAWASKLLKQCHVLSIFDDAPTSYPEVTVQEVLRRQPQVLISATDRPVQAEQTFWAPHRTVLNAPVYSVDPDVFSRFTLRLPVELKQLCYRLHNSSAR